METLDGDRLKQQQLLRQKLAEKRRMREEALKKKHGTEMAKEVLEQKKELKDAERNAVGFFHFIFFTHQRTIDYFNGSLSFCCPHNVQATSFSRILSRLGFLVCQSVLRNLYV